MLPENDVGKTDMSAATESEQNNPESSYQRQTEYMIPTDNSTMFLLQLSENCNALMLLLLNVVFFTASLKNLITNFVDFPAFRLVLMMAFFL